MSDSARRTTKLTEERRLLLQALLEEKGIAAAAAHTIKRINNPGHAPLSFAQKRMWFLDQLQPNSAFYTMFEAFHLRGPLSFSVLERSYNELLKRHNILRTRFVIIDEEPVQLILPHAWTYIPEIDLRACSSQERELLLHHLATQEAEQPFVLGQGPLLRAWLIALSEEEYVLFLTMHHIVSDGWSVAILVQELATLYRAFVTGKPSPFADLPIQLTDYAYWQQEWLKSEQFLTQLTYWKQRLSSAPALLELPTDYPRPSIQSYRGRQIFFTLPSPLLAQLKVQCVKEGVTPFMWLLATFQAVLYRYSGQEDILVGSPMAGRKYPELEELIGYFANTLVLRAQLNGSQTFRELLKQVKEVTLDAFAHQEMPFEKLVEELQIERSLSHNPLFQVMFVLQNLPPSTLALPNLQVQSRLLGEHKTTRFDLTLALEESVEGNEKGLPLLVGSVEYNSDLFAPRTMQRFVEHFRELLTQTLADPGQHIVHMRLLTQYEYQEIVINWNQEQQFLPAPFCLHHLFEQQVTRTPDAAALVSTEQTLTYRQIDQQANRLAHFLRGLQVGPEVPVALYLERSSALLVSILGILKAGGTYVPFDLRTPPQRLSYMLEDTQAPIIITRQHLQASLPASRRRIVCLENLWSLLASYPDDMPPESGAKPENLAYIIYTSGSTGQPKGVQITHAAVCNLLSAMCNDLAVNENAVIAALASCSFDMSVPELFLPLICGAQEVLFDRESVLEPGLLLTLLRRYGVTCMQATPTMWSLLLEAGLLEMHPSMTLICGAEALPWGLATQLLQARCPLYNFYGPTETTVWSMQHQIQLADGQTLIGRPLANTQVYILDQYWQPVPVGVPGELYIGGSGLARGYLNRPAITAERFVPHPFAAEPGARLYRTGDLVRYRRNGTIEYLGRCDRQIKLHGFRIEPGEIENALRQHPAIRDAVVHVCADQPGQKRLVAYLVYKRGGRARPGPEQDDAGQPVAPWLPDSSWEIAGVAPTNEQWRGYLRELLPEYMLPSAYITLAALPLTPNGKVDYQALTAIAAQRPELQKQSVVPRDHLEAWLVQLWQKILAINPVGIMDNFFDLGGNSFLAVRLMAHIQRQYQHKLPLSYLFQEGTIEALARKIRQSFQQAPRSPIVLLQQGSERLSLFCVHPGGGSVLCYRDLVRHLGRELTVYGVEDLRLYSDEAVPAFSRLEEMAAFYVAALRTVQPEGPYLLSGWSFGGLMAFEMARQLYQQGQRIVLLAMFDTQPPPLLSELIDVDESVALARFAQQQANEAGKELSLSFEKLSKLDSAAQIRYILQQMQQQQIALPEEIFPWVERFLQRTRADRQMIQSYRPGVFPGPITFFQADVATSDNPKPLSDELEQMYFRPAYGWEAYSDRPVRICVMPGTHDTLMNAPAVQLIAEELKQYINEIAFKSI